MLKGRQSLTNASFETYLHASFYARAPLAAPFTPYSIRSLTPGFNKYIEPFCNAPCQQVTDRRRWYVVVCCYHRTWYTRYICSDNPSNNDDRIALKPGRHNRMPANLSNYSLGSPAIGYILSRSYANFSSYFLIACYRR